MDEKAPYIETGIIFALRVYFGVQVGLSLLSLWGQVFIDREPALQDSIELNLIRNGILILLFMVVVLPAIPQFFREVFFTRCAYLHRFRDIHLDLSRASHH